MGLEWEYVLLQGLHSASPRYTPAYALTAPNGALPDINNFVHLSHLSSTSRHIDRFGYFWLSNRNKSVYFYDISMIFGLILLICVKNRQFFVKILGLNFHLALYLQWFSWY